MYDLLIRGGMVVDPSQGMSAVCDVALANGKVAAVEVGIPTAEAREVFDAGGLIVTPGLIDLHVHAFWGVGHYGIQPDPSCIAQGVTTALDAGTAGAWTFPAFRRYTLERCDTRLFALLNISSQGLIAPKIGELEDIRWADVDEAVEAAAANRDYILGIKVRLGRVQALQNDVEACQRAVEAAERLGVFVMTHVGNTHTALETLSGMLRPGDVVTHVFHPFEHGVLDDDGRVIESIAQQQERGVLFDVAHGVASFSFRVAERALEQGFRPDSLSSDLHSYSIVHPVNSFVNVLSKFLYLGLSLDEVIRLSTIAPARILGMDAHLGTLRPGAEGDVTILRMEEGRFTLTDAAGLSVEAPRRLAHAQTVSHGRLYRPWLR